jgi:hypothetical protein
MRSVPGCSERCRVTAHDPLSHYLQGISDGENRYRPKIVCTGSMEIDLVAHTVTVLEEPVRLSDREWRVLAYLAERPGIWCTTDEIVAAVWGPEWITTHGYYGPSRRRAASGLIGTVLHRLRARLGPAGSLVSSTREGRLYGGNRRLEIVPSTTHPEEAHDVQSVVSDSRERCDSAGPALMPARKEARGGMFAGFSFGHSIISGTRSYEAETRAHAASH